ncbi:MAG TPA: transketolase [Acidimicrobiales bacterium]|nr:transketolase [Acidimicrobiales bacterium]
MTDEKQGWQELGQQLRVDAVKISGEANSGHPTSSMSAADLMAVLISKYLHYDFDNPENPANDHLIFSKGHASPLLYAIYKACGAVTEDEMATYRRKGSRLEGHPTPDIPWVDVATGSLGQGLPIAVGVALAGKKLDQLDFRTWVLCGDSEMAEGSMWEAFEEASYAGLDNLTAIIDVNRLGQSGETRHGWNLDAYRTRAEAFGWHAIEVDGHDVEAVDAAYAEAVATKGKPTVVIAKTKKGAGVKSVEDQLNAHGKAVPDYEEAIEELGGDRGLVIQVPKPPSDASPRSFDTSELELPAYELGKEVATRKAYGEALAALGKARSDVVALDGEVSNSTYSEIFREAHPDRYFECYIAEQQMIATAVGFQVQHWNPFASTFAAFLTRAYDFIRMAAVSQARMNICGSHAGVSIGEDGPSQMGLEDLAAFRAIHDSTVLYPSDAVSTAQLVVQMADLDSGIAYLRTTRGATPVIYGPEETFPIGGSKVVKSSDDDKVTIVAAGITLHEALKAADVLAGEGIAARVVDLYSVKPLDTDTLVTAARATAGRVMTVEDHWAEGGIGDAVAAALAEAQLDIPLRLVKIAVTAMPGSAKPDECIAGAGLDAESIAGAARKLAG